MGNLNYKPAEHEVSELKLSVRSNPRYADLKDSDIIYSFVSYDKAFVTVADYQHRYEKRNGRWMCTRGPWD